jgi:Ni/Fe-hydrogenase subunit HybB-like protein
MQTGLVHLHNVIRWVILILLIISLIQAFTKNKGLIKTSLFLLITSHITLLFGVYQWLAGRYGMLTSARPNPETSLMKDTFYRFYWVEHAIGMIVAIVLITVARKKSKQLNFKGAGVLYLVALIIILATIPWPFRAIIGRPWFPGM